jgi:uncharacterized protein involved in exopolysaccharide biosynthesis
MTEEKKKSEPTNIYENEDDIDLLELAKTIWNGKKLIIRIVLICTIATAVVSLFMTNIYTAEAVLKPVASKEAGRVSSLATQFGGLASIAGINSPGVATSTELVSLLKSKVLKKQVIEKYNLLPVLFPKKWDEGKKAWKTSRSNFTINPLVLVSKLMPEKPGTAKKEKNIPDTWDGIRALDAIVNVDYDMKKDEIRITVNFRDSEKAAAIANYFVTELNERMSSEAKRMAVVNKAYLERQLPENNDILVQQKIYSLIAEKIETMMMAEVNEGFSFKVLDPPMAPDMKSKPKRAQMVIVAFMISLFLGVFVVLFRDYLKKIKAKSAGGPNAE